MLVPENIVAAVKANANHAEVERAEREQWAYAVAYALAMRKRHPHIKHGLDKYATLVASSWASVSTDSLKLKAARAARRGDMVAASGLVRAVAKRIIKGDT